MIAAIAVICAGFFFVPRMMSRGTLSAVISSDSGEKRVDLTAVNDPYELVVSSNGHYVTLMISPDGVRVINADCPDRLCMNFGLLDVPGDCAVCLPARVVIRIEGSGKQGSESGVDAVL